jgi:hypothetical protein
MRLVSSSELLGDAPLEAGWDAWAVGCGTGASDLVEAPSLHALFTE